MQSPILVHRNAARISSSNHWTSRIASRSNLSIRIQQRRGNPISSAYVDPDEEVEAQLEAFMRRQAELESGLAPRKSSPDQVLGAEEVEESQARAYCRDIVNVLKLLKKDRDMGVNEIRLTLAIEDPRARDRRKLGVEDASGVSRDEIAAALMEVAEGKVPSDRIALRELHNEMMDWPGLDSQAPGTTGVDALSPATTPLSDEAAQPWRNQPLVRPPIGRDPSDKPQQFTDMLPEWVGYGALYLVSVSPAIIAGSVVLILFLNSVK